MATGQPDGSILIDTELDPTGFDAGSKRMEAAVRSLVGKVNSLGPAFQRALGGSEGAVATFQSRAAALREQIADMQRKLEEMGGSRVQTPEYARLNAEIEKTEASIDRMIDKQEKMESLGVSQNSAQWRSLQYDLEQAIEKYNQLIARKQELEATGAALESVGDTAEYSRMVSDLGTAQRQLADMEARITALSSGAGEAGGFLRSAAGAAGSLAMNIANAAKWAGGQLVSAAKAAVSHMGKAAKFAAGKLVSGLKAAASQMAKLVVPSMSRNQFDGLISGARKFTLSLLGARGVYALLRKAVSAYMQENQALANTMSACWSGIGNILGPIISRLISLVASAVSWVTAFLKLFGIVGKSATKAIGAAGGAAKKETDKLKKQLASFDELNILSDNGSDSGGGGGGGGADAGALPEIALPDWAKLVADQIKAGDWKGAATTLATELNRMVDGFSWTGLGQKVGKGLDGALTFLATFLKTFDWMGLGNNLANGVNEILRTVDWGNLGTVLSGKFRILLLTAAGFLLNLDWSALAQGFTDFAVSFFDGITEAIAAVDWYQLGQDVAQFLGEVDWDAVFDSLCGALGAAFGALGEFLLGLFEEPLRNLGEWLYDISHEDGEFCIEGLIDGLLKGMLQFQLKIQMWVYNHIFKPFIDGFKKVFGIASPSTVMEEQGNYIIEGLLQGITKTWKKVGEWFGKAWGDVKQKTSEAWDKLKTTVSTAWGNVKETVTSVGGKIKDKVSDTWSKVKESVSSTGDKIGSTSTKAWETVKNTVTDNVKNARTAAENGWKAMKTAVADAAKSISSDVTSKFKDIYSTINDKIGSAKDTVSAGFSKIKSSITDNVSGAVTVLKNIDWGSIGSNIVKGIGNGLSNSWNWLKDKAKNLANNLLSSVKELLGIHSPSSIFRDQVGLMIGAGVGKGVEKSKSLILPAVKGIASAISDELLRGDYSVDLRMEQFSDRITNGLDRLMNQLQAIADRVTFVIPTPAMGSIVPPGVLVDRGGGSGDLRQLLEEIDDDLADVIASAVSSATVAIVEAVRDAGDRPVYIDGDDVTDHVRASQNRRDRMLGKQPVLA